MNGELMSFGDVLFIAVIALGLQALIGIPPMVTACGVGVLVAFIGVSKKK